MRSIKNGIVAVALAAVLASCGEDDPSAAEPETQEPATDATLREAACQRLGGDGQALAPVCWAILLDGLSGSPRAELDLPAGFTGSDWGVWFNAAKGEEWGTIALRAVGDVYPDPCNRTGPPATVGPSVRSVRS